MTRLILEDGGRVRKHRQRLEQLFRGSRGPVRVASAYVTNRDILLLNRNRDRRLLVPILPMDLASGATSLESLRALIESGVKVRSLADSARLHAKVYIFGDSAAIITSANLTDNALCNNLEAGAEVSGDSLAEAIQWFDDLWEQGQQITPQQPATMAKDVVPLRRRFIALRSAAKSLSRSTNRKVQVSNDLTELFTRAGRFFVCNTNRRYGKKTATGSHVLEEQMYDRGMAVAWTYFNYPKHMERVEEGDAVFMFAKGVGITRIGRALGPCEILYGEDDRRILPMSESESEEEWRVPVQWVATRDAEDAFEWVSPNATFLDVKGDDYIEFRKEVLEHFLAD